MNEGLTAQGKAPRSRTEAVVAFEAALLELRGHLGLLRKEHAGAFWTAYNRQRLWLVAQDVRPNRGEILVRELGAPLDAPAVWVKIATKRHQGDLACWHHYEVVPTLPLELARQRAIFKERGEAPLWAILGKEDPSPPKPVKSWGWHQ